MEIFRNANKILKSKPRPSNISIGAIVLKEFPNLSNAVIQNRTVMAGFPMTNDLFSKFVNLVGKFSHPLKSSICTKPWYVPNYFDTFSAFHKIRVEFWPNLFLVILVEKMAAFCRIVLQHPSLYIKEFDHLCPSSFQLNKSFSIINLNAV